jgi:prepilin-type N-terminal cleavage/methylation domain-containing protein
MTKPTQTSQQPARPASRRFAGFTLIELMVSISIMAIIMLAFGGLMTRTNVVVTQGEKRMRADASASAISRLIRNDIRKMTKNGFLRMSSDKLMFVIAGKTQSAFSEQSGDGAIIIYGRDEGSNVLYRKILVLAKKAPTTAGKEEVDCLLWNNNGVRTPLDLAELQVMSTGKMTEIMDQVVSDIEDDSLAYPPRTLHQVTKTMWMVLAGGCKELKITSRSTKKNEWKDGGGTHTRHNQSSWPAALKFKFKLSADSLVGAAIAEAGTTSGDVEYEIICPIGH